MGHRASQADGLTGPTVLRNNLTEISQKIGRIRKKLKVFFKKLKVFKNFKKVSKLKLLLSADRVDRDQTRKKILNLLTVTRPSSRDASTLRWV